jgi:O-antigen/teichoic acid export membrane protein
MDLKRKPTSSNKEFLYRGIQNISYLSFGHFITLLLNIVGFIYIARFLGKYDYGIFVTVGSFVGLFSIFTLGGLNTISLREGAKNLDKMGQFIERIIGFKIVLVLFSIILCLFVSLFMPYPYQEKVYILVFSLTLFYHSFNGLLSGVFQAFEKMQYNAILQISNRMIFLPLAITVLLLGFGLTGIFIISLLTQFISLVLEVFLSKKFINYKFKIHYFNNKMILKSSFVFSLLAFTNLINTRVDVVMISWLSNPNEVGIYGVATQIVNTALTARNLISVGFFPIFVKLFHTNIVKWNTMMKYSLFLSIPISVLALVSVIIVKDVIIIVFGQEYSASGDILRILIFYVGFTFFTIPFVSAMKATGNELTILKLSIAGPIMNIIFNYILYYFFGLNGIALSTLIVSLIMFPISTIVSYRVLKKGNRIR